MQKPLYDNLKISGHVHIMYCWGKQSKRLRWDFRLASKWYLASFFFFTRKNVPSCLTKKIENEKSLKQEQPSTQTEDLYHLLPQKDLLSHRFNEFGVVLKVLIVTNAATDQPTGSF
jgi:hypothetical protein